jgi:hypothetical protein
MGDHSSVKHPSYKYLLGCDVSTTIWPSCKPLIRCNDSTRRRPSFKLLLGCDDFARRQKPLLLMDSHFTNIFWEVMIPLEGRHILSIFFCTFCSLFSLMSSDVNPFLPEVLFFLTSYSPLLTIYAISCNISELCTLPAQRTFCFIWVFQ